MSSSNEKAAKKIVQSVEDTRLEFLPENKSALLVSPSLLLVSNPIGVRYIGAESFRSKRRGSAGGWSPVTICIAAISAPGGHIVAVSDRMLSAVNDVVAARDNATMKNLRLTKKWGIMFSANSELLYPFAQLATLRLANLENESDYTRLVDVDNSLHEAESACVSAYQTLINRRTVQEYLSRIGFSSIEDFKVDGLSTFGQEIFFNYFNKIETFDLGIEFIVYGFDKKGSPHIITIENPGVVRNIKRYVSE